MVRIRRTQSSIVDRGLDEDCTVEPLTARRALHAHGHDASSSVATGPLKSSSWTSVWRKKRREIVVLVALFAISAVAVGLVYQRMPDMGDQKQDIKVPRNVEDVKRLAAALSNYRDDYWAEVLLLIVATFTFLQTFSIPGSLTLCIVTGALYPLWLAVPLMCLNSALGSTCAYLLSQALTKDIVTMLMPERIHAWRVHVDTHRNDMFFYLLFLRVTPFLPNSFVSAASPVLNVPIVPFFFATFFGVGPQVFMAVTMGETLQSLSSPSIPVRNVVLLALAGSLALLPVLLKNRLSSKFAQ